jgi:[ribosomal protein S5]-alanine N-acetyltransferase
MQAAIEQLAARDGVFAIADAVTGEALGNIGWIRDGDGRTAEGYYWVAAPARGRGVAVAALELVWDDAVAHGIERMRLVVDADNVASRRVAERAGFTLTGAGEPREHGGTVAETVKFERTS